MEYIDNIITITTLEGAYILIINPIGEIILGDYISNKEVGGTVCWMELF